MTWRGKPGFRTGQRQAAPTLACLALNRTDYTPARSIEGAEAECRQSGFFLISSSVPDEATSAALTNELAFSRRSEGLNR